MPDCSRALVTARMPSPWKVWPAPSLSSSTSFVKERSMAIRGLGQGLREPHRDRRHEEHQREHEQAHEQVRYHRAEDVTHGHLRRRHALHGHEEEPMRRQQEAQLHADKEHHAEPYRVDSKLLDERHKDGERDHHHADLLDEEAEEDQHEHHHSDERERRQAERGDDLDHAVARSGKRQDLREGHRADDDEEDHSGYARRAAQRLEQVVDGNRPVGRGQQDSEKRADRGGFGRRGPGGGHGSDHDDENRDQRHDVLDEGPQLFPATVFGEACRGRERRIHLYAHHDVHYEGYAEDQSRNDAPDQELGDRDTRKAPEQHGKRGGRDQHVHRADRHQRAGRHGRVIPAREHYGQHQAPEHRGSRDGRPRDGREHRARDHRDHREPSRNLADQALDAVDHFHGEPRVEQHFSHEDEKRDGSERKARDRPHGIAGELDQSRLAAKEQPPLRRDQRLDRDRSRIEARKGGAGAVVGDEEAAGEAQDVHHPLEDPADLLRHYSQDDVYPDVLAAPQQPGRREHRDEVERAFRDLVAPLEAGDARDDAHVAQQHIGADHQRHAE